MHSKSLLISARLNSLLIFILLLTSGCWNAERKGLSFNPVPLSKGQYVEYVNDSMQYDKFHIRFAILDLNSEGLLLETDYFTPEETLKVKSFHKLDNNYIIDTFVVQFNSDEPFKFIPPNGSFIFDSPIPNLFMWAEQIDTTNWKTIILNNKQYSVFTTVIGEDTVFYCSEIPIFNIAKMFINSEHLQIYNYGNKGSETIFTKDAKEVIAGSELPQSLRKYLKLDK